MDSLASLLPLAPWCCFAVSLALAPTFPLLRLLDVIVQACRAQPQSERIYKASIINNKKATHSLYPCTVGGINSRTRVFFWSCCGLVVSGKEYLCFYVALFSHRMRIKATLPVKEKNGYLGIRYHFFAPTV